jgi:PAS domain S-box-containing protein
MALDLRELILDRAHNAAVSLDAQGRVTYWNPSAERIFGRSRKEAVGRPIAELIIPERMREAHLAGLERFLEEGVGPVLDQRLELSALRADGSEFPVELTISALDDGSGWSFHAFIQDISERRDGERERERLVEELRAALRGSERRFEAIVGSLADPVTIRDREDRLIYANPAALKHLGVDSLERLRATHPASIMDGYRLSSEDGREITMGDIPSVRILRGERSVEPLLIRTIERDSGRQRWELLKAAPVIGEDGEVEATITIIEDVSEQRRSELQSTFLADAGAALAASLDYEETLRTVAQLAVPDVVDWCAVDLLDEAGDRRTVAVAHIDPDRLKLAEALRRYVPERLDPEQGLGLVLRTGKSLLYPEISDEMLEEAAVDEHHLELLRAVGFRSVLIVPMRLGERVLGTMTLVSAESVRVLDQLDLELAEQIAARAAVAIENSRLYSERSSIARTLQQSLLPDELPEVSEYEVASLYLPAIQTSMVGGDFYDVWAVGDSWMILIGDVTGKGVDAAALTALVRHTVRTASEFESSPAALLAFVDGTLKKRSILSVCTALCARLDGSRVTFAVGGHPLPLRISSGRAEEVGGHGPLLGAFADVHWDEHSLVLGEGSTLVFYTDGITDARGATGERFGLGRLSAALERLGARSAASVIGGLTEELARFQAGAHTDDVAAIAIRRLAVAERVKEHQLPTEVLREDTITTGLR